MKETASELLYYPSKKGNGDKPNAVVLHNASFPPILLIIANRTPILCSLLLSIQYHIMNVLITGVVNDHCVP